MKTFLIVPCSAKKNIQTNSKNDISAFKLENDDKFADNWIKQLLQSQHLCKASHMYSGVAFKSLNQLAINNNFNLLIMSAGLGLLMHDSLIPSYNATFSAGPTQTPFSKSKWWEAISKTKPSHLGIASFKMLFSQNANSQFIITGSKDYLLAIEDDLYHAINFLENPKKQLSIISSQLPKKLQQMLGKNCFLKTGINYTYNDAYKRFGLALNLRNSAAIGTHHFVEELTNKHEEFDVIIEKLTLELASPPLIKKPKRKQMSPEHIKHFIKSELIINDRASMSLLHTRYRESGFACSDENFKKYFKQIKIEIKE
ncbi:DUF6884 domain-containing protein [Aliivibrio fischeri]|uniref:DUF6884 domain-containing protein n=1 Tax=Aliivibrio fischeri TaxID=668 RepID=UPI0007C472E0|nr:DUF6884 domain-containing protein [Aliivibrio fischeri]